MLAAFPLPLTDTAFPLFSTPKASIDLSTNALPPSTFLNTSLPEVSGCESLPFPAPSHLQTWLQLPPFSPPFPVSLCPSSHSRLCCACYAISVVSDSVTLWTITLQAPLTVGFSRQDYWNGLPCPPPGDRPDPGIEPSSLMSPALAGGFSTPSATWEAHIQGKRSRQKNPAQFCSVSTLLIKSDRIPTQSC